MTLDHRRCRPLLGTFVEIAVGKADAGAVDDAFAAIGAVHAAMSFHEETSDLARLRRAPVDTWVAVSPETVTVLRAAGLLHAATEGLFDVTVGAALVRRGLLPPPVGVTVDRCAGSAADIEVDAGRVRCRRRLLIDLGGIAKGHAVDRAIAVLAAAGVRSALVNAGGDLRVLGDAEQPVSVRDGDGAIVARLMLADGALATSSAAAGAARSVHVDAGGRALANRRCVSIAAPSCLLADAMTKVAIVDEPLAQRLLAEGGGAIVYSSGGARSAALGEAA